MMVTRLRRAYVAGAVKGLCKFHWYRARRSVRRRPGTNCLQTAEGRVRPEEHGVMR